MTALQTAALARPIVETHLIQLVWDASAGEEDYAFLRTVCESHEHIRHDLDHTRTEIAAVLAELDNRARLFGEPLWNQAIRGRLRALVSDPPKAP